MDDIVTRFIENLGDRTTGPMKFRRILQPTIAVIFAVVSGLKDAKSGKAPYLWALLGNPEHRHEMLKDGWKSVGEVLVFAMVLDVIYQLVVARFVYPGEVIIVAMILAIVPYLIVRDLVNRVAW